MFIKFLIIEKIFQNFLEKKIFFFWFYNDEFNKQLKKVKKNFFWQDSKSWFVYFTETEKPRSGNELKTTYYVQTWLSDVKNLNRYGRPIFVT